MKKNNYKKVHVNSSTIFIQNILFISLAILVFVHRYITNGIIMVLLIATILSGLMTLFTARKVIIEKEEIIFKYLIIRRRVTLDDVHRIDLKNARKISVSMLSNGRYLPDAQEVHKHIEILMKNGRKIEVNIDGINPDEFIKALRVVCKPKKIKIGHKGEKTALRL